MSEKFWKSGSLFPNVLSGGIDSFEEAGKPLI